MLSLVSIPVPFASTVLDYGAGRLRWWSFRETTGTTPAVFDLYDGTGPGAAQVIMCFSLGPGESTRDFMGHHLVMYEVGLWLQVTSGTAIGALQTDDEPRRSEAIPVVLIDNLTIGSVS